MPNKPPPLEELRIILEGMASLRDMEADEEHPDPQGDALDMIEDAIEALNDAQEINRARPMNTKHTPGPWKLSLDTTLCRSHRRVVTVAKSKFVLRIDGIDLTREEDQANARLVAAAPDLLAALEQIARIGGVTAEAAIARAAITKATSA